MTPAEFVAEALSFRLGQLIVVSGPDLGETAVLLSGTQAVLASSGIRSMVYDAKGTEYRPARLYKSCDAKIHDTGDCAYSGMEEAIFWEEKALLAASGSMIVLIGNQFDPYTRPTSPTSDDEDVWNGGLPIDVVIDILQDYNVRLVPYANHGRYGSCRELFPFVSRLYYYYGYDVTFIKTQEPEAPPLEGTPVILGIMNVGGGSMPVGPLGPSTGKSNVNVTGANFSAGAKVLFGGKPAMRVSTINGNLISCLTPANPPGIVDVQVTNPDGRGTTLASAFYYF